MDIKSIGAVVPVEGIFLPVQSNVGKEINNYGEKNPMNGMSSTQSRNTRFIKNYGKLGKAMESNSTLGEMVDIYV